MNANLLFQHCWLPSPVQYDAAGGPRLLYEPLTFEHIVGAAFDQIREYGRSSTAAMLHLLETIAVVGGGSQ